MVNQWLGIVDGRRMLLSGGSGVQVVVHSVGEGHGVLFSGWPMYAPSVCVCGCTSSLGESSGRGDRGAEGDSKREL